jgi:hypothetical protein
VPAVRRRFWIETTAATVGLVLALITLVLPAWLEVVFGIDPDQGSGSAEWILVGVAAAVAVIASIAARRELRLAAT